MAGKLKKAVILARGLGTRMRRADSSMQLRPEQASIADTGLKAMIPVGRPFLDYVLSGLADVGYEEVCLVIGPEHNLVREYYAGQRPQRLALSYALQPEPRGTADAVLAAEACVGASEFLVMNSDNYYPATALRTLRNMKEPGTVLFAYATLIENSNIPPDRVRAFAYAEVDHDYLLRLTEKPGSGTSLALAPHALISMNLWRFTPAIFDHCRQVPRSVRGEYELPEAVNRAIQHGMRLRVERSDSGVLDLSQRADISALAERLRNVEVRL